MRRGVGILLLTLVLLATLAFNASPGMAAGEKRILIIHWDRSPYGAGYDRLASYLSNCGYHVDVVDKSRLYFVGIGYYDAVIIPDGVFENIYDRQDFFDFYDNILLDYARQGGVVLIYAIPSPVPAELRYNPSTWDHFAVGGKEGDLELYNPYINPSEEHASEGYMSNVGIPEHYEFSWQDNDLDRVTTIAFQLGHGVVIFTLEKIEVGLTSRVYDTYWERFVDALLDWSFAYANGAPIDRYASTTTITTTTTLTTTVTTTTTRYTTTTTTMYSTTTVTPTTTVTETSWTIIPTTVTYTKSQSPIPGGVIILSAILVTLLAWRFRR